MKELPVYNPKEEVLDDEAAKSLVASTSWYHSFELRDGLVTPGSSHMDPGASLNALGVAEDLQGLRTLDIGAWDGPLTFEMERRGAEAFALDIQDPRNVGFAAARKILGAKAAHYKGSVYDLPCQELRELDVVLFRGVYYHLKHPILAFERIAAALKLGGRVYFEGEGLLTYAEDLSEQSVDLDFQSILDSDAPICLIYPNTYKGASNWFVPTPAALRAILIATGFEVTRMEKWTSPDNPSAQRLFGEAVKVRDGDLLEHPIY